MMRVRKSTFVLAALALTGFMLTREPSPIDAPSHWGPALGAAALFLFWCAGVVGWGSFLADRLGWSAKGHFERLAGATALGSLFAYFCGFVLLWLIPGGSLAKPLLKAAAYLWTASGALVGNGPRAKFGAGSVQEWPIRGRAGIFWFSLAALAVLLRGIGGLYLQENGDPLTCYLPAYRSWFDSLSPVAFLESPIRFLASAWDSLALWGHFFLAGAPGEGLAEGQYFAQWISVGLGYAGVGITLAALLEQEEPRASEDPWLWLAVIAGLSVPSLRWTAGLAKHDLGVCFWALAALLPLRAWLASGSTKQALVAGALAGATIIAKPTAAIFVLALGVVALSSRAVRAPAPALRFAGAVAAGGALGALPVVVRNLVLTGNPLYPWLSSVLGKFGNDPAGPWLRQGFAGATAGGPTLGFAVFAGYLKEALLENPLNLLSLVFLIPHARGSRDWPRKLAIIAWVAVLVFSLTLRKNTEIRYLGPALPMLAALGVWGTRELLREHLKFRRAAFPLLAVWLLAISDIPLFLLARMAQGRIEPPARQVLGHYGGHAKRWLRANAKPGELILALGDSETYYASGLRLREIRFFPEADRAFSRIGDPAEAVRVLKELGARYYYRGPIMVTPESHPYVRLLDTALAGRESCVRYQEPSGIRIYDVSCLN
ncbi:MAG: hypothetical protein NDJ89_10525 [Oligoflexia bacterium]|nr:hypothetical protein [Oligoflexia bacterium]